MYFLYIIYSTKLDRYYTGHTDKIEARVMQHNTGCNKSTAKANDWVLAYMERFATREEAKKREIEIKRKKSRKYIEWLISSVC